MDQSCGHLVNDRSLKAKEMQKNGESNDISDKVFPTNTAVESAVDGTSNSIMPRCEPLPENVDLENKMQVLDHRSSACNSCKSPNDWCK